MEELKQTEGLIPFIKQFHAADTVQSSPTLKDFEDFFKMYEETRLKPVLMQVGGGFMLSIPDELFIYYWSSGRVEVLCSNDSYNEIIDRAIKLKLNNIPEKIKL